MIAIVFIAITIVAQGQSNQATTAYVFDVKFIGDYKIADGEWTPISDGKHISSTNGRVELKGVFILCDVQSGEEVFEAENGTIISLYLDLFSHQKHHMLRK